MPLLRAITHLDAKRQQRDLRFGLLIKAEFGGIAASLAALWPLGLWLGDFRVMLGLLIVEAVTYFTIAYLFADRPYRIGWNGAVAARALRFGWPVLAGGLLAFAAMQGERLIVANQYTATDLGLFSAALTLAMAPTFVAQRVVNSMFLPLLARHQDNAQGFRHRAELSLETLLVNGLCLMLLYVLAGPTAIRLAYGADFAAGGPLVAILGITFTLRMIRSAPANIVLAKARTMKLLIANAVRFLSLLPAFLIAIRGGSLEAIALTSVAGEAASLLVAYALIAGRDELGPVLARRMPLYGVALALALLLVAMAAGLVGGPIPAIAAVLLWIVAVALCRRFLDYLGHELLKVVPRKG
jgi:O-antigen/teichoic acid export membrane protein